MNDDTLSDDPLDLSALRPDTDSARFDAMVGRIARDAMAARGIGTRRAPRAGVARELAARSRTALLAAAIVLAAAIPTFAITYSSRPVPPRLPATDALGIPRQLALILHSTRDPSLAELHAAVMGDAP